VLDWPEMILETPRLILRRWRPDDAARVASIYAKPNVMQFIPGGVWNAQRTRELGIRAALGARPAVLLRMVLGESALRATLGLALGLIGAFALTKLLSAYLYGVKPRDPVAFVAAPVMLLVVALVATWLPARRAARVEPMSALRHE